MQFGLIMLDLTMCQITSGTFVFLAFACVDIVTDAFCTCARMMAESIVQWWPVR